MIDNRTSEQIVAEALRDDTRLCLPDGGPVYWDAVAGHVLTNLRAAGRLAREPGDEQVERAVSIERVMDTLAYYHCRSVNPKADHPRMGYHAMSEDQRGFLRERQREAAEEVVRMFAARVQPSPAVDEEKLVSIAYAASDIYHAQPNDGRQVSLERLFARAVVEAIGGSQ